MSKSDVGDRIRRELGRSPTTGTTRGELAILLMDVDDDDVSLALYDEVDADRVVVGVQPAFDGGTITRYYLTPDA